MSHCQHEWQGTVGWAREQTQQEKQKREKAKRGEVKQPDVAVAMWPLEAPRQGQRDRHPVALAAAAAPGAVLLPPWREAGTPA